MSNWAVSSIDEHWTVTVTTTAAYRSVPCNILSLFLRRLLPYWSSDHLRFPFSTIHTYMIPWEITFFLMPFFAHQYGSTQCLSRLHALGNANIWNNTWDAWAPRTEKEKEKEKKYYEDKRFLMVRVIATLPSGLLSPPPGKRSKSFGWRD